MANIAKTKEAQKKEVQYFQYMEQYVKLLSPHGFRISDEVSKQATAIFEKCEAIAKELGYYPTKRVSTAEQVIKAIYTQKMQLFG